jgi:hypothetical protein
MGVVSRVVKDLVYSRWRIVPLSPTAQTSVGEKPQTPNNLSFMPVEISYHLAPSK